MEKEILICDSCHFSFEQQGREMVCVQCTRALDFFRAEIIKASIHTVIAASLFWGAVGVVAGTIAGFIMAGCK